MTRTSTDYYRANRANRHVVHTCPHCPYETTGPKSGLVCHINARHVDECDRPFQCEHCERGFAQLAHLHKHCTRAHGLPPPPSRKITAIGYLITLTEKEGSSYKTQARRSYYRKHTWLKSREINEGRHEYLPGLCLKTHDIHYDAQKGLIQLSKCELRAPTRRLPRRPRATVAR